MSNSQFITIQSLQTTGSLASLTRSVVLLTRETVSGFTPDPATGLYKINSTDLTTFNTNNPTSYGLQNSLKILFAQAYSYSYAYVLSAPSGVTTADLTLANSNPRAWSYIVYVDRYNGDGTGGTSANYFADLAMVQSWGPASFQKIVLHTYSIEENPVGTAIILPAELALGGSIGSDNAFKTIVSNSKTILSPSPVTYVYDNIWCAVLSYVINGPAIARSWGSLSDAHDFADVSADTYSAGSRSVIANASLGQYNGDKDRAGSLFLYDTQLNDKVNPPLSLQIETQDSIYYIDDYVYVYVHNALQAAGQTGVPNDDAGIQMVLALVRRALNDCFDLGLILAKPDNTADFSAGALTASQVTQISANWQTTGVWPAGVVYATIRPFSAAHYVTISFAFQQ